MPDGDIVHAKLSWLYQKPYQWLCEGVASLDECASKLIDALRQDLTRKGDIPVELARYIADKLSQVLNNRALSHFSEVDWPVLNADIETIVRQAWGSHHVKELALNAAKKLLQDFRYGKEEKLDHPCERILENYMNEVYLSSFKERIPKTDCHHNNIDEKTLLEKIAQIEPTIKSISKSWSKKIATEGSFSELKKTVSGRKGTVDLEENLL